MHNSKGSAQEIKPKDLYGKWKVKDWLFFEEVNENASDHKSRMNDYHRCLNAKVTIDSNGIKIQGGNNICYFDPCEYNFAENPRFIQKKIVADDNYTKQEEGAEMIDSNIVGKGFVQLLDKQYCKPTLTLLDAGCTQSYGNFTMKICIINKNKIGFFMGEELLILERN